MSDDPFMPPPPPLMTPDNARDVGRAYTAMARHLSELGVQGEAGRMERDSQRWLTYAIAMARIPPKST
jgi:hypothetical protein